MRNKLIEIIDWFREMDAPHDGRTWTEHLADHLLAEGIIVPPCKVGDYIKRKGDAYLVLWRVDAIHYYREGQPHITATHGKVTLTTTFDGIGKVFTKEEAEAALAEREGKG